MKPLIAGNWKMYGRKATVQVLLNEIVNHTSSLTDVDWLVFPPFVYLDMTAESLKNRHVQYGGQNCYTTDQGAYTGEVSPTMLKDLGAEWVLVGHSERRQLFAEHSGFVAEKFFQAIDAGLTPILCVGETDEQRDSGDTFKVLTDQLAPVLSDERTGGVAEWVVAYEPVWAIGTGNTATPEEAQAVHNWLRALLHKQLGEGVSIRLLYGGSVKPENAEQLFAMTDIDGFLIGGASLKAEQFTKIGELCIHY